MRSLGWGDEMARIVDPDSGKHRALGESPCPEADVQNTHGQVQTPDDLIQRVSCRVEARVHIL